MSEIKALVETARSLAVVVGKEATFDHWAVASSLMKALQSLGKSVVLVSPVMPNLTKHPELQPLFGLESVVDHLGKQNLIVSFDYTPDSVEAVSYAIDEQSQRFLLTIKPKPGAQPLAGDSLKTSYAGSAVEVIFLIGVHSFDQLGGVYLNNQSVFASAVKVSLHQFAPELAQISFTTQQQTCMAEFLPEILTEMGIQLTSEAASNLLYGIEQQTNWLSSLRTTAETFAVVSALLRAGAKRQPRPTLQAAAPQTTAVPAKNQKSRAQKSVKPTADK